MPDQRAKKIILIDDEKSFVDFFSFILKKEGYEVISFNDPSEALKNIVAHKDADLILLDLAMPEINGFNLLAYLKKDLGPGVPTILFITNLKYAPDGTLIDDTYARNLGAEGVIHKTDDYQIMIEKIKEILKK
jgi:CheY-like chemotaxis protein